MFGLWRKFKRRQNLRRLVNARAIFPYFDGEGIKCGDPFALWRALTQDKDVNLDTTSADADEGREPGTTQYLDLVCRVFGVKRWNRDDNTGLLDWQIMNLVAGLTNYIEELKKNTPALPTSPPPTAPPCSISPEPQNAATNACSVCGPT